MHNTVKPNAMTCSCGDICNTGFYSCAAACAFSAGTGLIELGAGGIIVGACVGVAWPSFS